MTDSALKLITDNTPISNSETLEIAPPGNQEILSQWLCTSTIYQHAMEVLIEQLPKTAKLVEDSTAQLTERFINLAGNTKEQSTQVERIIDLTRSLQVGDQRITLDEFTQLFSQTLSDSIEKVLTVSKRAIKMVYMLDEAMGSLKNINSLVTDIQKINKQVNLLALNAAIEASRAGEAGKAFSVVASEVREVSAQVKRMASDMEARIATVSQSVEAGYAVLQEVATTDMSDNIMAKERLDELLNSLVTQNDNFGQVLADSARATDEISRNIGNMVMDIQFQDRTTQYVENSVRLLNYMVKHLGTLCDKSRIAAGASPDDELQKIASEVASQFSLSEFTQLFRYKCDGTPIPHTITAKTQQPSNDAIELF